MDGEAITPKQGITRRGFLVSVAIGAAAVIGFGATARRRLGTQEGKDTIWGLEPDSLFMPRKDQLEKYLRSPR
ncbi:MAG: hypothetical protein IIC82_02495 [Chloroflexi bacterium]|nr:hypothetical protein [Chloroflexota bacterium]